MEVNTKFELGDTVWFVDNNKVVNLGITGITISVEYDQQIVIMYSLHYGDKKIEESKAYRTKEELLKSL